MCLTFVCLSILQIYANSDVKLEVRSPYMAKVEIMINLETFYTSGSQVSKLTITNTRKAIR